MLRDEPGGSLLTGQVVFGMKGGASSVRAPVRNVGTCRPAPADGQYGAVLACGCWVASSAASTRTPPIKTPAPIARAAAKRHGRSKPTAADSNPSDNASPTRKVEASPT